MIDPIDDVRPARRLGRGVALTVEGLRVDSESAKTDIVAEISFSVAAGETLGIVGESGSGKTTLAMALLGIARQGCRLTGGSVRIAETEILAASERERRRLRARLISFVPQDPSTALSPGMRIGRQILETVRAHHSQEDDERGRVRAALDSAQLPTDEAFLRRYPHQLSGGQQQRVTIAIALVSQPTVIVLDEPTTGLDVTTQARLLEEIKELSSSSDMAIVYVSHDLAVIRNLADRVAVMYGGRIVEEAPVDCLFHNPGHPYTRRLLEAIPRVDTVSWRPRGIPGSAVEPWNRPPGCPFAPRCDYRVETCDTTMPPTEVDGVRAIRCWRWRDVLDSVPDGHAADSPERPGSAGPASHGLQEPVLAIQGLHAGYGRRRLRVALRRPLESLAVQEVSLRVGRGACVGVVGESGSGKTTLMRCIAGLHVPDSGEMRLRGSVLASSARRRPADLRRQIQLVPQNPDSSLNPRQSVAHIVGRPLRQFYGLGRRERQQRVTELLERVRLRATMAARLPRELSGGEKQRVAIARALAAKPELLLCDEITSALDVAVQAGILHLLQDLRNETGMAMVFVSHDLAVVRAIADEVVVMRHGRVRETNATDRIFGTPEDEYTRELLAAVPRLRDGDYPGELPKVPAR